MSLSRGSGRNQFLPPCQLPEAAHRLAGGLTVTPSSAFIATHLFLTLTFLLHLTFLRTPVTQHTQVIWVNSPTQGSSLIKPESPSLPCTGVRAWQSMLLFCPPTPSAKVILLAPHLSVCLPSAYRGFSEPPSQSCCGLGPHLVSGVF